MICTFENCEIVPRLPLAVDVSARTLICVVVVPSVGGMVGTGVGGSSVNVGAEIAVAGKVAVMNAAVGGTFSVAMLTPQPVRTANNKTRRKMMEYRTSLLYLRIM